MASCLAVGRVNPPDRGGRKEERHARAGDHDTGLSGQDGRRQGHVQEQTLPQLQKMEGFKGFVALGDRQSGKVLGVAFWESEEACGPPTKRSLACAAGRRGPPTG
jgi:hypothetical protein